MKTKSRKLLIIMVLLIIFVALIIKQNIDIKNEKIEYVDKTIEDSDIKVILDLNNENLLDYINIIKSTTKNDEFYNDQVNINELDLNTKINLIASTIDLGENINYIDESLIKEKYENVFGINSYKEQESIIKNNRKYKYNRELLRYELSEEIVNSESNNSIRFKITDAYNIRNDNKNIIEFIATVAFCKLTEDGTEYYKDKNYTELIGIYDENIIKDESSKFNKYKYTFELDSDNIYVFTKIEKIDNEN